MWWGSSQHDKDVHHTYTAIKPPYIRIATRPAPRRVAIWHVRSSTAPKAVAFCPSSAGTCCRILANPNALRKTARGHCRASKSTRSARVSAHAVASSLFWGRSKTYVRVSGRLETAPEDFHGTPNGGMRHSIVSRRNILVSS